MTTSSFDSTPILLLISEVESLAASRSKYLNTIFHSIIMGPNSHSLLQYAVAGGPRFNDVI
jgi:hypothetical protein